MTDDALTTDTAEHTETIRLTIAAQDAALAYRQAETARQDASARYREAVRLLHRALGNQHRTARALNISPAAVRRLLGLRS